MGHKQPKHIFFSAVNPPNTEYGKKIHNLPREEFIKEIYEFGGTPKELFDNRELLDIYLPILRADFKIIETKEPKKDSYKINCDVTVLSGISDTLKESDISKWVYYTDRECNFYKLEGGHFFAFENNIVVNIINELLKKHVYVCS